MRRIAPAARARAERELADIQQVIDNEGGEFDAQAWDWLYYSEQVRRAAFAIDDAQLKPYFSLERVLHDGVFWTASRLFGIRFVERFDIPVYQPDVRVWEIFDCNGEGMALFYGDYYARDSKAVARGWMCLSSSRPCKSSDRLSTMCAITPGRRPGRARYCPGMR